MNRKVPGVPGRAHDGIRPPAAIGELDRLRLAEHDHARRLEPLDGEGGLLGRRRRPGLGARPRPMARVVEEVLDGDGDSMEGPHRMGGPRLVPGLGGKPRLPFEDTDEGMRAFRPAPGCARDRNPPARGTRSHPPRGPSPGIHSSGRGRRQQLRSSLSFPFDRSLVRECCMPEPDMQKGTGASPADHPSAGRMT